MLARLFLAKEDCWIWRDDNGLFWLFRFWGLWLFLPSFDGAFAFLALVPFDEVYGEADDPGDAHESATDAACYDGCFRFLPGLVFSEISDLRRVQRTLSKRQLLTMIPSESWETLALYLHLLALPSSCMAMSSP